MKEYSFELLLCSNSKQMQKTHLLQKIITISLSYFVTVNCIHKRTERDHNYFKKYVLYAIVQYSTQFC